MIDFNKMSFEELEALNTEVQRAFNNRQNKRRESEWEAVRQALETYIRHNGPIVVCTEDFSISIQPWVKLNASGTIDCCE